MVTNKSQEILDSIDALAASKLTQAEQVESMPDRYMLYHDYYLIQSIYNIVIDVILKKEEQ